MDQNNILLIDFGSTFITIESLDELASISLRHAPNRPEQLAKIEHLTQQAMTGELSFSEALTERLALFAPQQRDLNELIELLHQHITPSFQRHEQFFRTYAPQIYIVTGGFTDYITPVVAPFGIPAKNVIGNKFIFDGPRVVGHDRTLPLAQDGGKIIAARQLTHNGPLFMIGDGYTDYEVREAGIATAFFAFTENIHRNNVTAKADYVATCFDDVLEILQNQASETHTAMIYAADKAS